MEQFEIVSNKIVASDPCYSLPTWCQGVINNVKNGTWNAYAELTNEGSWGDRISTLTICHKDHEHELESFILDLFEEDNELPFTFGVDSGQFGFFDFASYRNDAAAKDLPKYDFGDNYDVEAGDEWYRSCVEITLGEKQWGVLPNGVVSTSGFGDGSYDVDGIKDANGEYVMFMVTFIGKDELDEDED
jgi:hypothetical protein